MCRQEGEMKFLPYNPEQAYLLPPRVADVLGKEHLCCFLRRVVDRLDLNSFEEAYEDEGRPAYAPELLVAVWLSRCSWRPPPIT